MAVAISQAPTRSLGKRSEPLTLGRARGSLSACPDLPGGARRRRRQLRQLGAAQQLGEAEQAAQGVVEGSTRRKGISKPYRFCSIARRTAARNGQTGATCFIVPCGVQKLGLRQGWK